MECTGKDGQPMSWPMRISVALVVAVLAGCGGGESSSPAGSGSNNGSGNTGGNNGGNTGSGGSGSGSGQTGMRVSRILYDFDNNGTFEGERRITYFSDGRIAAETYVYTDDGTPDTNLGSFTLSGPKDNQNQDITYTYSPNGTLFTVAYDSSGHHMRDTYTYDANGMVTRLDSFTQDSSGALISSLAWVHSLNGLQLNQYKLYLSGSNTALLDYTINYNGAGQVDTDLQTVSGSGQQNMRTYTWRSDGKISAIDETDPAPGATYQASIKFTYDSNSHLVSRLYATTYQNETYRWDWVLDNNGLPIEKRVDLSANGTVEAVVRYEYEQGPCTKVYLWYPRSEPNFVINTAVPYKPGTGYVEIPVCG